MKKKQNKKKKEQNRVLFVLLGVLIVIAMLGGGTYAYLNWQTDDSSQKTTINVIVKGGALTITGDNVSNEAIKNDGEYQYAMRPTNDCTDTTKALIGTAEVKAENETERPMKATPRLDITLTVTGTGKESLTTDDLSHIHWAVVETNSSYSASKTCKSNPDYTGTFAKVIKPTVTTNATTKDVSISYSSLVPSAVSTSGTTTIDITNKTTLTTNNPWVSSMTAATQAANTLSFIAPANQTTYKYYKVYVWVDEGYTHTNTGNVVSDPMENLKISVKWSTKSTLIQQAS